MRAQMTNSENVPRASSQFARYWTEGALSFCRTNTFLAFLISQSLEKTAPKSQGMNRLDRERVPSPTPSHSFRPGRTPFINVRNVNQPFPVEIWRGAIGTLGDQPEWPLTCFA